MQYDTISEAEFDRLLSRELNSRTHLKSPPSAHLQAHRDYERQKFGYLGRNPQPRNMGYNLSTECTGLLRWAHRVLTDDSFRKMTGFTRKTIPRRAVCRIAEAIGYRYMRGLESIEHKLRGEYLATFQAERIQYRHKFEKTADYAHACNDNGQRPDLAIGVVLAFHDELLSICPWFDLIGQATEGARLRHECAGAIAPRPQYD